MGIFDRPAMLNRNEAAERLGLSARTLAEWACIRKGPPFLKLGGRVRYRVEDLDAWLETCVVRPREDATPGNAG